MKVASSIARLPLGLIFLVFALNGFLHFIPIPPPTGLAGQFMGALFAFRRSGHWRTAALGEPLCTASARTSGTRDREHQGRGHA
jgi:hypothetical protein